MKGALRLIAHILLLFICAEIVSAQTLPTNQHKRPGINLSLWNTISTQRPDSLSSTFLNIGFFSKMNQLNGVGVNVFGAITNKNVNGLQLSALYNLTGNNLRGLQISTININGNEVTGVSISGLIGITGNNTYGVTASGLANVSGEQSKGILIGGLLNVSGKQASGVHIAGLTDITGGNFNGIATSGLLNVAGGYVTGVQLAGLGNIAAYVNGLQLSALGNVAGSTIRGLQIGAANTATHVHGLQIGLFNYAKNINGLQLGLVNANPHTRVQLMLFGGNSTKLNIGARFKNRLFYTIIGGGTHYLDFSDRFSAALFYRAGLALPSWKKWTLSGDVGYQHIETFKNKNYSFPARLYALQARLNLEYRFAKNFALFASGGYGGSRYYTRNATYDKGAIIEGGIILF